MLLLLWCFQCSCCCRTPFQTCLKNKVVSKAHEHRCRGPQLPHAHAELGLAYLDMSLEWEGYHTTGLFLPLLCFRSPFGPRENMVPCGWLPDGVLHWAERARSAGAGGVSGLPPDVLLLLQGDMAPTAPVPRKPNYSGTNRAGVRGEATGAAWSFSSFWHEVRTLCLTSVSWNCFRLVS